MQLQTSVQFFIRNAYLNCIWLAAIVGLRPSLIIYHRELVILSDGATVGLDWANLPSQESHHKYSYVHESINESHLSNHVNSTSIAGLVIICHGLAGSSKSEYVVFQVSQFDYFLLCLSKVNPDPLIFIG